MTNSKNAFEPGLAGVPVAETTLSYVDGARGRLWIAGDDVERLAGHVPFEEVTARLWDPEGQLAAADVMEALGAARVAAFVRLPSLGDALEANDAMDALRAGVAHWEESAPERANPEWGQKTPRLDSTERRHRWGSAAKLAGAVAVISAAWARRKKALAPIAPDPELSHAADFLRMVHGATPSAAEAVALDAYFVTVVDHGLNASAFAARVVASTGSDLVSAVTAAIGALKGPLHGGAPGPVLDMLDAVAVPARAAEWLGTEMDARRRIMGMGHRVYRVRDPRAAVLERAVEELRASLSDGAPSDPIVARLELARAVEREATALLNARHPGRALRANVEFYTAILLEALRVPRELFSATFATARVVGWAAHVDEERRKGRLIRPSSVYVGRVPDAERDAAAQD